MNFEYSDKVKGLIEGLDEVHMMALGRQMVRQFAHGIT